MVVEEVLGADFSAVKVSEEFCARERRDYLVRQFSKHKIIWLRTQEQVLCAKGRDDNANGKRSW